VSDAAGAYVVVDGVTYRVLGKLLDAVRAEVEKALADGSRVTLDVVGEKVPGQGVGQGTLHLHGARVGAIAVLSGPLPAGGQPVNF
jgi:hypothetical protein